MPSNYLAVIHRMTYLSELDTVALVIIWQDPRLPMMAARH